MKLSFFGIKSVLAASLAALAASACATQLVYEPFSYSPGNLVGNTNSGTATAWTETGANTGTSVTVAASSLSYAGLAAPSGGKVSGMTGLAGAEDPGLNFASAVTITDGAGQNFYYSAILNVTSDIVTTTSDYFMHISPAGTATTAFYARLHLIAGSTAGTFRVGISNRSEATVLDTVDRPTGTPIFVVVKYSNVAGATNDVVNLFINPALGGAEPAPTQTTNTPTSTDATTFGRVNLRQPGTVTGGAVDIDEIRVGTAWADVTPAAAAVQEWSMY